MSFTKNIICIGAGYVGGPTMAMIAAKCPQYKITSVDIDGDRIAGGDRDRVVRVPAHHRHLHGDDVKSLAVSVCAHRLGTRSLTHDGSAADEIFRKILETVPVPQ